MCAAPSSASLDNRIMTNQLTTTFKFFIFITIGYTLIGRMDNSKMVSKVNQPLKILILKVKIKQTI